MSNSYIYQDSKTKVQFEHSNSLAVFMAIDCIDAGFDYEIYSDFMIQWPTPRVPKSVYQYLSAIILNK